MQTSLGDIYYIEFDKNVPLNLLNLDEEYEVLEKPSIIDPRTGLEIPIELLNFSIEEFDFEKIPTFKIYHQQFKQFEIFNNSLFAKLDTRRIRGLTIRFEFKDYVGSYPKLLEELSSHCTVTINVTNKSDNDDIFRFSFPQDKFISEKFDDILYLCISEFSKRKLIKIDLSKCDGYKEFKEIYSKHLNKYSFLDKFPNGIKNNILSLVNLNFRYHDSKLFDEDAKLSKEDILRISWVKAVLTCFTAVSFKDAAYINTDNLNTKGIKKYEKWKEYLSKINELKNDRVEQRHYISQLLEQFSLKEKFRLNEILFFKELSFHSNKFLKEIEVSPDFGVVGTPITRLFILLYHTDFGTKYPNGIKIDYENFNKADLFMFWLSTSSRLLFDCFNNQANFIENYWKPAVMKNEKLFNKNFTPKNTWYGYEFATVSEDKILDNEMEKILNEALDNKIYTIPYGAIVEIKDPVFKYIQIYEELDKIRFFVFDDEHRYLYEELDLNLRKFNEYIFGFNTFRNNDENLKLKHKKNFYTIFTTLVRDFWTVIERERNLGPVRYNFLSNIEKNKNVKRIIYLQRIRYTGPKNFKDLKTQLKTLSNSKGGWRTHSLMKLRDGFKPSPLQLLLASKCGVVVPDGHTFKKAHSWGRNGRSDAEITYRSRNLTGMFFISEEQLSAAEKITSMSPLKFEEFCHEYVLSNGWDETVTRVTDGGIDIEAYKQNQDGKIIRLFAQCKHHKRNINREVVRELIGSKKLENKDYDTELMIIISGKFASGCYEDAEKENVKLIDGYQLINYVTNKDQN